jgi:hypothetical protein
MATNTMSCSWLDVAQFEQLSFRSRLVLGTLWRGSSSCEVLAVIGQPAVMAAAAAAVVEGVNFL